MNYLEYEAGQETRTENLIVRLTREEKHTVLREAQKLGISVSAFTRLLLRKWMGEIDLSPK